MPLTFRAKSFSKTIADPFPQFVQIYGQAEAAESHGLDEICGAGYRRSLEFLIKLYLLSRNPNETAQKDIRRLMLGACIDKYVTSVNLKQVARRATWLGNDETHFERRWGGKELKDLKLLIDLTVSWIETELLTEQFQMKLPG